MARPHPVALSAASLRTQVTVGSPGRSCGWTATPAKPGKPALPALSTSTPTGPAVLTAATTSPGARLRLR